MPSIPNFTKTDILRALLKLEKEAGRASLVKELELGEGTMRSILGILKKKGLIISTRQGHSLAEKGKALLREINTIIKIKKLISKKIFPNLKKTAVLLKKYAKKTKISYRLRDIAVKNNAEGALIFLFDKKLMIPDYEYKKEFKELENLFDYKNKDILIITFADSYKKSETSALKVAESVNANLDIL